jgi:hypothetical protein
MRAFAFPGHNRTLVAKGCDDLPVYTDGANVTSCWELDPEDLELLRSTGYVWITLQSGVTQPPIKVQLSVPQELLPDGKPPEKYPIPVPRPTGEPRSRCG